MILASRLAVATAAVVCAGLLVTACASSPASSPTQPVHATTSPADAGVRPTRPTETAEPLVIGPERYGALRLSMPASQALETGLVIADQPLSQPCGYYRFRTSPPGATDVMVSVELGVVVINAPARAHTPEGVGTGSRKADVRAAYPALGFDSSGTIASVDAPGGSDALYRFEFDNDEVATMSIQTTHIDCAG